MPDIDIEALRAAAEKAKAAHEQFCLDQTLASAKEADRLAVTCWHIQGGYADAHVTLLALLSRLAAAEADRDRLLRVAEAAKERLAAQQENDGTATASERLRRASSELRTALAALDAKEPSDAL